MAQEIPHFSENFIYLSPSVSLKLGPVLKSNKLLSLSQ